jgi:hypothetical protein
MWYDVSMTTTPDEMYHAGAMWIYKDARGIQHVGHFQRFNDFGGTDVPYTFRDCATGELSVVSGQRLKGAGVTYSHTCEIRDRIIAELR